MSSPRIDAVRWGSEMQPEQRAADTGTRIAYEIPDTSAGLKEQHRLRERLPNVMQRRLGMMQPESLKGFRLLTTWHGG